MKEIGAIERLKIKEGQELLEKLLFKIKMNF